MIVVPRNQVFEQTSGGAAFGRIYWRAGTGAFPSRDWDDFIIVILTWWLDEMRKRERRGRARQLLFMDGPYFVRALSRSPAVWELAFCRRRAVGTEVLFKHRVRKSALVLSLTAASKTALAKCRRAKICGREVDQLESALKKFSMPRATLRKGPTGKGC